MSDQGDEQVRHIASETGARRDAVSQAPRAVVLYDRDCGFCRWSLARILDFDRSRRLRPVALQDPEAARLLPGIEQQRMLDSAHLVLPDGRVYSGGDAVAPLVRLLGGGRLSVGAAKATTGLSRVAYGWVAGHRRLLGRPLSDAAKTRATTRIDRHSRD